LLDSSPIPVSKRAEEARGAEAVTAVSVSTAEDVAVEEVATTAHVAGRRRRRRRV